MKMRERTLHFIRANNNNCRVGWAWAMSIEHWAYSEGHKGSSSLNRCHSNLLACFQKVCHFAPRNTIQILPFSAFGILCFALLRFDSVHQHLLLWLLHRLLDVDVIITIVFYNHFCVSARDRQKVPNWWANGSPSSPSIQQQQQYQNVNIVQCTFAASIDLIHILCFDTVIYNFIRE